MAYNKKEWSLTTPISPEELNRMEQGIADNDKSITNHKNDFENPHNVTAEQINTYTKNVIDNKVSTVESALTTHVNNTENPHNVTASQIGAYTKEEANEKFVDKTTKINGKALTKDITLTINEIDGNLETTRLIEPDYVTGGITPTTKALFDVARADRGMFLPPEQVIIEQSTDGGQTWEDAGVSDGVKREFFAGLRRAIYIPRKNGVKSTDCLLRFTITAMRYNVPKGTPETQKYNYWNSNYVLSRERYFALEDVYLWVDDGSDMIYCKIERATGGSPYNWLPAGEGYLKGRTGGNYLKVSYSAFGGNITQVNNYWNWRFTFRTCSNDRTFNDEDLQEANLSVSQYISQIKLHGRNVWDAPNNLMRTDRIYSWDAYQNTIFPAQVIAESFKNSKGEEVAYKTEIDQVEGRIEQLETDIQNTFVDSTYTISNGHLTFYRKDGTTKVLDLPLEMIIESGRFDEETNTIILTMANQQTIEIPVGAVVTDISEALHDVEEKLNLTQAALDQTNETVEQLQESVNEIISRIEQVESRIPRKVEEVVVDVEGRTSQYDVPIIIRTNGQRTLSINISPDRFGIIVTNVKSNIPSLVTITGFTDEEIVISSSNQEGTVVCELTYRDLYGGTGTVRFSVQVVETGQA